MDVEQREHFDTFGFVTARGLFDPEPISTEVDETLRAAFNNESHANTGSAQNRFRYVPMMCELTPVSLSLLAQFAKLAVELLASPVLPGRAKGTEYYGSTGWHRDSKGPPRSLGILCYLEPLSPDTGALQVIAGTHRHEFADTVGSYLDHNPDAPGVPIWTSPGDAIMFDERLYHSSSDGTKRRQWRVDFVADSDNAIDDLRRYYSDQHEVGWDGGYDVDLYPSYGSYWQTLNPSWNRRLEEVGAYSAAAAEESFVRANHRAPTS